MVDEIRLKTGRTAIVWTLTLLVIVATIMAIFTLAQPVAPQDTGAQGPQRRSLAGGTNTAPAYAGNVTELRIDQEQITENWQGYYGTVSGQIVLDDAQNASFFTWTLAAAGQVYATVNATVPNWNNVTCLNLTDPTVQFEQDRHEIDRGDTDNVTNTFDERIHPAFTVGSLNFAANECNLTAQPYTNTSDPDGSNDFPRNFNNTIIMDGTVDRNFTIYMAYINDNQWGFNGTLWDFQMLVPELGNNSNTAETTYYFYVELQ